MAALGIRTTRALAVVTTGAQILREGLQPGAVLTRVAQSHVRVGTFEFFANRGDREAVRLLADYVIARHYPDATGAERPYRALLETVIDRTAELIASWQLIGFIHGVMNTDNLSIAGETIDYGPCAFMDTFHPATVYSSIDITGRYAYGMPQLTPLRRRSRPSPPVSRPPILRVSGASLALRRSGKATWRLRRIFWTAWRRTRPTSR
jgi:uncharacterized protein YdiU (UPF0061 family)